MELRTHWLWFSKTDNGRVWAGLDRQFCAKEQAFFFGSTHMVIGNGHNTKFWEDRWINGRSVRDITHLLHACIPKRCRKNRTVPEGMQAHLWVRDIHDVLGVDEICPYLLLQRLLKSVTLFVEPDKLIWKWNEANTYNAKSAYLASFHGSIACND